jgi:hypothetical protein
MTERFTSGPDHGDEDDGKQAQLEALMETVEFRDKVETALQVVSQADTLPADMVAVHVRFLKYWGLLDKFTSNP